MELSRLAAIAAKEQTEADNHELVNKMKTEMDAQLEKREKKLEEDLQKRKFVIK